MRRLLLLLAYLLVVTPYGLLRRVLRDPLARRLEPDAGSYLIRTDAA